MLLALHGALVDGMIVLCGHSATGSDLGDSSLVNADVF